MNTALETKERISLVFNPISSSGNTEATAHSLAEFLATHGYEPAVLESKRKMKLYKTMLQDIENSAVVLVVGGDGTLRKMLKVLSRTNTAVYMIPGGNESLFAKHFGMTADKEALLQALNKRVVLDQYFGLITSNIFKGKKPFFIMASMGLDSLTVANIGKRKGPLNDMIYGWQGFKALLSLHHPTVTLTVNGETVVEQKSGYVIVANCPDYAKGINLVPDANPGEKNLMLGFLENSSFGTECKKSMHMLMKKPVQLPFTYFTGETIEVELHSRHYPIQVDGDYFRDKDLPQNAKLTFTNNDRPVRVLIPDAR